MKSLVFVMGIFSFLGFLQKEIVIEDFSLSNSNTWVVVNDGIMGGISSSSMELDVLGNGVFSGKVSLENNGGFTLVKRRVAIDFSNKYSKIQLRVKGDGKQYQFRIKPSWNTKHWYIQKFQTKNDWEIITLELKDFYPSLRGNRLSLSNFVDNRVESIAFLIGNKKQETFKLTIDYIKLIP